MESLGIYWVPIYTVLMDGGFNVTLANAHQVKAIPSRKTNVSDSQWLVRIFSAGLIKLSYMPEKMLLELRSLTRLRVNLLETQTSFKNRVSTRYFRYVTFGWYPNYQIIFGRERGLKFSFDRYLSGEPCY
jgi:transposase